MNAIDQKLDQILKDFIVNTEREYKAFLNGLDRSLNPALGTPEKRRTESVNFAKQQCVSTSRIIKTPEEMRFWLGEGWKWIANKS